MKPLWSGLVQRDERSNQNQCFFFSSNNHATPSEAAVGLKLQPQCKKLNDSDGVFFNTTAKKGFSVQ